MHLFMDTKRNWLHRFLRKGLLGLRLPMRIFVENFMDTAADALLCNSVKQMCKYVNGILLFMSFISDI